MGSGNKGTEHVVDVKKGLLRTNASKNQQNDFGWQQYKVDWDNWHSKDIEITCWTYSSLMFCYAKALWNVGTVWAHNQENTAC